MTGQLPEVIQFHCPACAAELTVPHQLAGVEGPCPSCYHSIRAPFPQVSPVVPAPPQARAVAWPPGDDVTEAIPAPRQISTPVEAFRAKYLIPPAAEEVVDDSWREKHQEIAKSRKRWRKLEKGADALDAMMATRAAKFARAAAIVVLGALCVWLASYMQKNKWKLPWDSGAVARPAPVRVSLPSSELLEDAEPGIPAAADFAPTAVPADPATIARPPAVENP